MASNTRYRSLDFLKGVCVLFVVITHYAWSEEERLDLLFPFFIDMAVPLFMILSGYVSARSLQKRHATHLEDGFAAGLVATRLVRFVLPFLPLFILEEILLFAESGTAADVGQIARELLTGGIGPGGYYVPLMVQFVFVFPLVFYVVERFGLYGVLLCGAGNLAFEILKSAYAMNVETYRLLIFRYILLIAFGCYMASRHRKRHLALSLAAFAAGVVYIVVFRYLGYTPLITDMWTGTSMWAVLYVIPLSAPLLECKYLKNPVDELLGKASYDIFLVQMVYYCTVADALYARIESRALECLLGVVICLGVGLLYHYVEIPATTVVGRWVGRLADRPASKTASI